MRSPLPQKLEQYRIVTGDYASRAGDAYGAFACTHNGRMLRIIASTGEEPITEGWEHVSVSTAPPNRPPNWADMCYVKNLFWDETETVIQLHPPAAEHINNFSTCLHLWKSPHPIALPPSVLVGYKELGTLA